MTITYMDKPFSKDEVTETLNPLIREWFFTRFADYSLTQLYGVLTIRNRKNILVTAPTGGTKTLTAFLSIINYLVDLALKNELEDKVYAIYVSPLKALSGDVFVNLVEPLQQIKELADKKKLKMQEIRVGLRTGDSTTAERAKMLRKAPHILVTTPETLAIVSVTSKFIEKLAAVEFVIIDEIHSLTNKRGVYLTLTLERLSSISVIEPVRIGLSATIAPLEEIAGFLVGNGRDCLIAEVKLLKEIDITLDYPGASILEAESTGNQRQLYHMLDEIIDTHRTTLIFTNTRNATEKIVHHLENYYPSKYIGKIGAHHSSMSKEQRFLIEERLRKGELKVVVSSTSLELGIDIGSIDIVVLIRSPKSVSRALQRIGRAGHKLHEHPKGVFIVTDRDDLVECAVLVKQMKEKVIDKAEIPKGCLDVLAQQLFGMAIMKIWKAEELLACVRKSYCYRDLSKDDFYSVVSYLAGDYALEHRNVYAKIWYDAASGTIGKKGKLARVLYMTNVGTIPSESFISVVAQDGNAKGESVGKIDEPFLERLKRGDVFVLGGKKYQFLFTRGMKAYVKTQVSKNPTIPSWMSEMLPLHFDIALEIGRTRRLIKERLGDKKGCIAFIMDYLYVSKRLAEEIYGYCYEQERFSALPDDKTWVVERFKEQKEYLVFHTMYGRRVHDALARAFAFAAATLRYRDVEMGINDAGFFLSGEKLDLDKIMKAVSSKNLRAILGEAIETTDVLKRRFRHCAARSLMILRNYKGREKSAGKQQVHSLFLLAAVRKISAEFPILREARREVLEDVMDIVKAEEVLRWVETAKVKIVRRDLPLVSPFGINLVLQGRSDVIKLEDKASFLKRMHELHLKVIGSRGN
ncbi:MAG TPA: ATP-dependent helicase [Candidatus Nanoarchaeia archaeon]|nr:ATP-dependent helicase [Candidatus Nanoarchaeia archaeon]